MHHLQAHDKSRYDRCKLRYQGSMPADSALINGLFLSILFLVFNTFRRHQIEKKTRFLCLCEAILWLWCLLFYLLALCFDANRIAICIRLHGEMTQITTSFDANRRIFRRDFVLLFALNSAIVWLSMHYKITKNSTFLKQEQLLFSIRKSYDSICKVTWWDLTYFPLTMESRCKL